MDSSIKRIEILEYIDQVERDRLEAVKACEHFAVGTEAKDERDYRWHRCLHPTKTDKYRLGFCTFTRKGVCEVTRGTYGLPPGLKDLQTEKMRSGKE